MTSNQKYGAINRRFGRDAGFIANVILTGCRKPTTRLRNLLKYCEEGCLFTCLSFRMPYEGFFVDGTAVRLEFLDKSDNDPENFRLVG